MEVAANWVPWITSIAETNGSSVQIQFNAANSVSSEFTVQSTGSLAPPPVWQTESGAVITTVSPGVFQAVVPVAGHPRFYRVLATP